MANLAKDMASETKNAIVDALQNDPYGTGKTLDIVIQASELTSDVLKSAMQEFLSGKAEKKGKISAKALAKRSGGKLESIEVSGDNIGDFLKTARKYDIDFAVKRDKTTEPPTYHVFFASSRTENFKRAFSEYAANAQDKVSQRGEYSREQLKRTAQKVSQKQRGRKKEKVRAKENER